MSKLGQELRERIKNSNLKNIAAVVLPRSAGDITYGLPFCKELDKQGKDVVFFCSAKFSDIITPGYSSQLRFPDIDFNPQSQSYIRLFCGIHLPPELNDRHELFPSSFFHLVEQICAEADISELYDICLWPKAVVDKSLSPKIEGKSFIQQKGALYDIEISEPYLNYYEHNPLETQIAINSYKKLIDLGYQKVITCNYTGYSIGSNLNRKDLEEIISRLSERHYAVIYSGSSDERALSIPGLIDWRGASISFWTTMCCLSDLWIGHDSFTQAIILNSDVPCIILRNSQLVSRIETGAEVLTDRTDWIQFEPEESTPENIVSAAINLLDRKG